MTLYFKIHTTVYKTNKKIHIHNNKDYKNSVEIDFSVSNLELLNKLFLKGIDKEELNKNKTFQKLYENGFWWIGVFGISIKIEVTNNNSNGLFRI